MMKLIWTFTIFNVMHYIWVICLLNNYHYEATTSIHTFKESSWKMFLCHNKTNLLHSIDRYFIFDATKTQINENMLLISISKYCCTCRNVHLQFYVRNWVRNSGEFFYFSIFSLLTLSTRRYSSTEHRGPHLYLSKSFK